VTLGFARFTSCRGFIHGLSPVGEQGRRVRDSRDHRASRVSADGVDRWGDQREFSETPALTLTDSFNVTQQSVDTPP